MNVKGSINMKAIIIKYSLLVFNLLYFSKALSQDTVLRYVKVNGNLNIIVTVNNKQLKTVFLDDMGTMISEKGFYDSLFSDNYIYKKHINGKDNNVYNFDINQKMDSVTFQLENKSNYLKKNNGLKIKISNYILKKDYNSIEENSLQKSLSIAYVFYSGCPSCINRLLSLDSLYKQNSSFGFLALMTDSSKSVNRFYKRNNLQIPFFVKQQILCKTLPTGCEEGPFFLVIDGNGLIIDCFDGNEKGVLRIKKMLDLSIK